MTDFSDPPGSEPFLRWARMLTAGVLFSGFWLWETLSPFFDQRQGRIRHAGRNLLLAILNWGLLLVCFGSATVLVADWAEGRQLGLLRLFPTGEFPSVLLAFLLLDGWMYLWHRANHVFPVLWRFHRMHHSDPHMDVTTTGRFHLGELIASAMLRLGLIPLLGVTTWQLLLYDSAVLAVTMLHHSNISLGRWERPLSYLIVTPVFHKVHHSHRPEETNSNYSTIFSFWDRLMSSYRGVIDPRTIVFGVDEFSGASAQTVAGLLLTPFVTPLPPTSEREK